MSVRDIERGREREKVRQTDIQTGRETETRGQAKSDR